MTAPAPVGDADPELSVVAPGPQPVAALADQTDQHSIPAPLRRWTGTDPLVGWYLTVMVTALAAFTRFWRLGYTQGKQFDEVYYATEAQEMLRYGYEHNPGYLFIVHPSVGKWAIAVTSAVFGNNEVGWRAAPAIAGTVSVFILVRVARRMLRSNIFGALAGLLLAMDGVSMVQSRVALLDIFLQLFVLAGFAALVLDRDQFRSRLADFVTDGGNLAHGVAALGPRPWRLLGAVLLALACGVKWSAASFLALFALMSLVWDVGALRSAGVRRPWRSAWRRCWLPGAFTMGVGAIVTYTLTWVGWFVGENSYNRHWSQSHPATGLAKHVPGWVRDLIDIHTNAYDFHVKLTSYHPYKSTAWGWLILGRPVLYTYNQTPDKSDGHSTCGAAKCVDSILLIGTPVMWYAFLPMLLWLGWHWATTRDWRAGTVLVAFVAGWAVWLDHPERTAFLFYMTPLMPFLALGLALAIGALVGSARPTALPVKEKFPGSARWKGALVASVLTRFGRFGRRVDWRVAGGALLVGAIVADFVFMFPVYTDMNLTMAAWQQRMWFTSWI